MYEDDEGCENALDVLVPVEGRAVALWIEVYSGRTSLGVGPVQNGVLEPVHKDGLVGDRVYVGLRLIRKVLTESPTNERCGIDEGQLAAVRGSKLAHEGTRDEGELVQRDEHLVSQVERRAKGGWRVGDVRDEGRGIVPHGRDVDLGACGVQEPLELLNESVEDRVGRSVLRRVGEEAASPLVHGEQNRLREHRELTHKFSSSVKGRSRLRLTDEKLSYNHSPAVCQALASLEKIPIVSSAGDKGSTRSRSAAPCEGRLPKTPFAPAGPRMEPPVSLPIA